MFQTLTVDSLVFESGAIDPDTGRGGEVDYFLDEVVCTFIPGFKFCNNFLESSISHLIVIMVFFNRRLKKIISMGICRPRAKLPKDPTTPQKRAFLST